MGRIRGKILALATIGATATAMALGGGVVGCSDEPKGAAPASTSSSAGGATPSPAASAPDGASDAGAASSAPAASPSATDPASASAVVATPELIAAGRSTYNANCIACHAMDPRQDGALGPALAGSPLPLIEARVMRAEYPPGYTPKRTTKVMVPMPHLQPKLPELAAYLGSLK